MQKNRVGIEAKIFVGSEIMKTRAKLVDRTTRNVRSRESGKRPGSQNLITRCFPLHQSP